MAVPHFQWRMTLKLEMAMRTCRHAATGAIDRDIDKEQ